MEQLKEVLEGLRKNRRFMESVTHWETIGARKGKSTGYPEELLPVLKKMLEKKGFNSLYTHQSAAFTTAGNRTHQVIVTPTASGKTLCYNLPVLQELLENADARALYIFPIKALSQDQQAVLNDLIIEGDLPLKVSTYDGDTPSSIRVSARESGRVVITNPDMLHSGILPNHPKWIKFLANIRFVVIDEVHTYRGIFGSHMTNLVRRLKRIARHYGSDPVFIFCSATIGNPGELAEQILEEPVELIDDNGAPSGEKHLIFYNPPLVDPVQGIRKGVVHESRRAALEFLRHRIKTIVFARSRIRTELIGSYIRESLRNIFSENGRVRIETYRGGYLPNERREIERGLRDGTVHGVVSTNALELGIDIGGLDVAILAGFPGSVSSVWQQAGRAGRRSSVSAALMIASMSPIDQYLVKHPDYFLSRNPETAHINPDNIFVLMDHVKCALFELPFQGDEEFGGPVRELLEFLEEEGTARFTGGCWYWADRSYPAEQVSLRSSSPENVIIINTTHGRNEVIGEMDLPSAKELLFKGAVYLHRGEQFISKELDTENKKCRVEEAELNYYTDSIVKSDIKILERDREEELLGVDIILGDVLIRSQVTKYKKIKYSSHESIGYGDIFLPGEEKHTRSAVLVFREGKRGGEAFFEAGDEEKKQIIASIGTLVKNCAPIFLLCDVNDIGVAERLKDEYTKAPSLYVYDTCPGGIGLSEGFIEQMELILKAAYELVNQCPCESGCPSCIGPDDQASECFGEQSVKEAVKSFLLRWLF